MDFLLAAENEQASKTLKVRGNCRNGGRRWNLFKPGAEKLQISRVRSCVERASLPASGLGFACFGLCVYNNMLD